MLHFLINQLTSRRASTAALGAAVLVAATSFVLLTSAAQTTSVRVRGSVETNYRTAYDILVRPRGSFSELERSQDLVRDNYLSGIFGGITFEEYEAVRRIAGVDIAAPIANVGYVLPFAPMPIVIDDLLSREGVQLYRLRTHYAGHNGASRYPYGNFYIYYTRRNAFVSGREFTARRTLAVCDYFREGVKYGLFTPVGFLSCFSELSPGHGTDSDSDQRWPIGSASSVAFLHFPVLISAIDPEQEARLLQLDEATVKGRYFREQEPARLYRPPGGSGEWRVVPALAATKTFIDERLVVTIERLTVPAGTDVPGTLASSGAHAFLTRLPGHAVARRVLQPERVYRRLLRERFLFSDIYWTPSDVAYGRFRSRLVPEPIINPPSIWQCARYAQNDGYCPAPRSNDDVQFRRLKAHEGSNLFTGNVYDTPHIEVVGRYDPRKLPGFSPLSRVPLETYYPPELQPADAASREALGGRSMLPTQNVGDYIQQPPLLLTTLEGMKPFLNPKFFKGASGKAPISVIRVRVRGVTGPDEVSQARVRAVAARIHDETGLDVDITIGSSPRELLVELPPGKFGRPSLLLKEGWVKKGVSVSFLLALARKDLALFTLIPLVCAFFLANGAFASARARRTEIGTLLCLGWSQRTIFTSVLGELALIGLAAGLLGTVLAALAVTLFDLETSLARTLLVLPVSLALALLAGLVPAWRAARSVPLDAVRPVIAGRERSGHVQRMAQLALVNLRRVPSRTLVGAGGLAVGVTALTLVLGIVRAFRGELFGTLLGNAISLQIRGLDFLAVGLVIGLAGLSLADVLFLNLRERAAELVTLRTVGWTERHLAQLVVLEALGLGLAGSLAGALLGFAAGALLLSVPLLPLALAAFLAALGGLAVAVLASLLPLTQIRRLTPPAVLAAE